VERGRLAGFFPRKKSAEWISRPYGDPAFALKGELCFECVPALGRADRPILASQPEIHDTITSGSRANFVGAERVCLLSCTQERTTEPVLMIRLSRVGARKKPYYRIVVIEKDRARDGRSLEVVGTYNPRTNPATVDLKKDRVDYWTGKGAQLSDRVSKLVVRAAAPAPVAT
jgi:small subunit ribosomal protein S16